MYNLVARPVDTTKSQNSCFGRTQELIYEPYHEAQANRRLAAEEFAIKYGYDFVHVDDHNPRCDFSTVFDPDNTTDQVFFEVREDK